MNSTTERRPLTFPIVSASLVGGLVSLLTTSNDAFWRISIFSHSGLIAIAFWIYQDKKVSLSTWAGLFDTFTLELICSVAVLLLFVFGFYVPFGLIITGRGFLTALVATFLYSLLRTVD